MSKFIPALGVVLLLTLVFPSFGESPPRPLTLDEWLKENSEKDRTINHPYTGRENDPLYEIDPSEKRDDMRMVVFDFSLGYGGNIAAYNSRYLEAAISYVPNFWGSYGMGLGFIAGLSGAYCSDWQNDYQLTRSSLGFGYIKAGHIKAEGLDGIGRKIALSLCSNKINKSGQEKVFNSVLIEVMGYYAIAMGGALEIYQFDMTKMEQGDGLSYKLYLKLGVGACD